MQCSVDPDLASTTFNSKYIQHDPLIDNLMGTVSSVNTLLLVKLLSLGPKFFSDNVADLLEVAQAFLQGVNRQALYINMLVMLPIQYNLENLFVCRTICLYSDVHFRL